MKKKRLRKFKIPLTPFGRRVTIGTLSLVIVLIVMMTHTEIKINQTPSLGYRVFICLKGLQVKRGDFVSFHNHRTAYFGNISYIKRLTGLPGDRIRIDKPRGEYPWIQSRLFVNGKLIGSLRTSTREGKLLHPLKTTIIPEGYVFVGTDHPHSFDSRYEEFGLVKQECMVGKCFGFFNVKPPRVHSHVGQRRVGHRCVSHLPINTHVQERLP